MAKSIGVILVMLGTLLATGCQPLFESRELIGRCGDGIQQQQADEQCDDGNLIDGDGCSSVCRKEVCGNGVIDKGEQCDDGTANDNGGNCTLQCKVARCGDGFVKERGTLPLEVCDDGNTENGDGCNPQCELLGRLSLLRGQGAGGSGLADGIGSAARLAGADAIAVHGGKVFFYDAGACALRLYDPSTARLRTIAGAAGQCAHSLYLDGNGLNATFMFNDAPESAAADLAVVGDTLYLLQLNTLRRVQLPPPGMPLDPQALKVETCADLELDGDMAAGLAADAKTPGEFHVASSNRVYRVELPCDCKPTYPYGSCVVTPVAGGASGHKDGIATSAGFAAITAMAVRYEGTDKTLLVADLGALRRVQLSSAEVTTVVGKAQVAAHRDGLGTQASFLLVRALVPEPTTGDVFVVQQNLEMGPDREVGFGWSTLRRVQPADSWRVDTVAGVVGSVGADEANESDGYGSNARLVDGRSAALLGDSVLIGQAASLRSFRWQSGQLATAAGVLVSDFRFQDVRALAALEGDLYATTRSGAIVQIPLTKATDTKTLPPCPAAVNPAPPSRVNIIVAARDSLLLFDELRSQIDRYDPKTGQCQRIFPPEALQDPAFAQKQLQYRRWRITGAAFDGKKNVYLIGRNVTKVQAELKGGIIRLDLESGATEQLPTSTPLASSSWGIAFQQNELYVTGGSAHVVYRVDLSGLVTLLGDGVAETRDASDGTPPRFSNPLAIVSTGTQLFIGEGSTDRRTMPSRKGNAIRQYDPTTGHLTTLLGPGVAPVARSGVGRDAAVNWPAALAFDPFTKKLHLADRWEHALLQID